MVQHTDDMDLIPGLGDGSGLRAQGAGWEGAGSETLHPAAMSPEPPSALSWVTIAEENVPAGQPVRFRLLQGEFSVLRDVSVTGRVRLQKMAETAPVPPTPLPVELVGFKVEPAVVRPGQDISLTAVLSRPTEGPLVVAVTGPFGDGEIPFKAGQTASAVLLRVPAGQPAGILAFVATLKDRVLPFTITVEVPPPPPVPELVRFVGPAAAQPGETITLEVGLSAAAPNGATVEVSTPTFGVKLITVMPGTAIGHGTLTIPVGQPEGTIILTADYRGFIRTHAVSVFKPAPPPPPPPTDVVNVQDHGVRGDGSLVQQPLQALINRVGNGTVLYFPPGTYNIEGTLRHPDVGLIEIANRSGITLRGEGQGKTRIKHGRFTGLFYAGTNISHVIEDLDLIGSETPGSAGGRSIGCLGPIDGLIIRRVDFYRPAWAYAPLRGTGHDLGGTQWRVTLEDCNVYGWGAQGATCHGGETIRNCRFIQDPVSRASTFSHGLYIANAQHVLVSDVHIEGSRGHSWQVYHDKAARYSQELGAWSDDITLRRITETGNNYGPVIASNGRYTNIRVEDCEVRGVKSGNASTFVVSGTSYPIVGLRVRNMLLEGGVTALQLMGQLHDCRFEGIRMRNHSRGVWAATVTGIPNDIRNCEVQCTSENVTVPVVQPLPPGLVVR